MFECFAIFLRVTEFAPPMSRRRVTNRRELLLPLLISDRPQTGVVFEACVAPGPAMAIHGKAGEPLSAGTCHRTPYRTAKQVSQTTEVAIAELLAESRVLARLVFQRIRPCTRSGMIDGQSCSPDERQRARVPIAPPDTTMSLIRCTEMPVSAPVPPGIETLFTQLARRRLESRTTEETR
jgi:hypothetical protein